MKESAKLHRPQKEREKKKLAKRLGDPAAGSSDSRKPQGQQNKRQNLGDGKYTEIPSQKPGDTAMKTGPR